MAALPQRVADLTASHAALRAENEPLQRSGKRQAAPFATGSRVRKPKRPGRQRGTGRCRYREAPPPAAVTDAPVDVPVTLEACPACGGPLEEARVDVAQRTAIPERPRPQVTQYRVQVCRCTGCGHQVRGQHPDVAPEQAGATAHRLGPRALAAAQAWHDGVGIPVRKVPVVMAALAGVQLTQGAVTQDARRRAAGAVGTAQAQWRAVIVETPVGHTDDTGWRVGGEPAPLMVFETEAATVQHIRSRHRHEAVHEVIPADEAGVMVTDRGRRDEAQTFDQVDQHKCLAHLLRSISDVVERKTGRVWDFGAQLNTVLQEALAWRHTPRETPMSDVKIEAEALRAELTYELRDRRLQDPDHQRRLHELGWHHDRGHVFRFLGDPRIEPTNHRAERALRPAVIARKVSHCSQNGAGAHAFEAFTSVVRTLAKQGIDSLVEHLYQRFRCPDGQAVPS